MKSKKFNIPKIIVFVSAADYFFFSHRIGLAKFFLERNYEVHLVCRYTKHKESFQSLGIITYDIPFSRSGINIFSEFRTLYILRKYLSNLPLPFIVHNISIKMSIYGSIAALFLKNAFVVNAVTGLGFVFVSGNQFIKLFMRFLISLTYNLKSNRVIVQNDEDHAFINSMGISKENIFKIGGTGLDVKSIKYHPTLVDEQISSIKFLFVGRILKEKGVIEFIESTKAFTPQFVRDFYPRIEFTIAGGIDSENRGGLDDIIFRDLIQGTSINWLGHVDNILELMRENHVIVLPSYREGYPRALIEACALGKAIITTNVPGCKDVVNHLYNGILVEPMNANDLMKAIQYLINNKHLIAIYGKRNRVMAEEIYTNEHIGEKTLEVYNTFSYNS